MRETGGNCSTVINTLCPFLIETQDKETKKISPVNGLSHQALVRDGSRGKVRSNESSSLADDDHLLNPKNKKV